ncbi:2-dehydropantoate 2-reductase [Streptomyces sp. ISL-10]|uniref:ketopantoate reductase family protein n=1 Tax=Streptomyces sp. ISL-10 TaxID=2819172 RepID=UPI001BEAC3D3|nr:2-dehydropantoate 2-reductase [Streptomyces sp. ISL-10]MBT2363949.1 2-dehydropantoate 2-reductase [Streptomyces sp. ISL-10]
MTESRSLNVAVLGPGGVGGLLAALMARAGHRVTCLAGEETVQALRSDGIQVSSTQFGEFAAEVDADTVLRQPVDLCLVTVKQTALQVALDRVPSGALGDGLVVPLLNGIEHPASLRERYRPELVAPGVIRVESSRRAPGRIVHGSPFVEIDLASSTTDRGRLEALALVLTEAGVTTRVRDDESGALWAKLAFLAPFALLTTRYGAPIGRIRTEYRHELLALVEEVAAVSRACGAPTDTAASVRLYDAFPAEAKSSMQRDAEDGRPLETDAIGGAVLRAAERHAVAVPLAANLLDEIGRHGR